MVHYDIDYEKKQTSFGPLLLIYGVSTCPEPRPTLNQILDVTS